LPRPRICRLVQEHPSVVYYKPRGIPLSDLREVVLPVEGLEALRLADLEKLDHETAASMMGVSRPTFSRVLAAARSAVARALVNGWAIRIEGGDYEVAGAPGPGGRHRGRGRGRHGRRRGRQG